MAGKLDGKMAVVTGASNAIGAGIARHLALAGASVVVNYSSSRESADRLVTEITRASGKAIAIHGNVSLQSEVERLFAESLRLQSRTWPFSLYSSFLESQP